MLLRAASQMDEVVGVASGHHHHLVPEMSTKNYGGDGRSKILLPVGARGKKKHTKRRAITTRARTGTITMTTAKARWTNEDF